VTMSAPTEAPPLADVQRTRDALIDALAAMVMPDVAHVEVLAELDAECRARAGGTEPDALSRLLFLTRQRQSEVERRIAHVRRRHVS
jgi:hypothetical protein